MISRLSYRSRVVLFLCSYVTLSLMCFQRHVTIDLFGGVCLFVCFYILLFYSLFSVDLWLIIISLVDLSFPFLPVTYISAPKVQSRRQLFPYFICMNLYPVSCHQTTVIRDICIDNAHNCCTVFRYEIYLNKFYIRAKYFESFSYMVNSLSIA